MSGKKRGSVEFEETHKRIATAALDLIVSSGIHGCDVRSVAQAAEVSTATLRSHYPGGKQQYLVAAAEATPVFAASDPLTGTPHERIAAYVTSAMQFAPRIATLLSEASLHESEFPEFAAAVRKVMADRRVHIQEFLDRLGSSARSDASPDVLLWLATGAVQAESLGDRMPLRKRRELIVDVASRLILK